MRKARRNAAHIAEVTAQDGLYVRAVRHGDAHRDALGAVDNAAQHGIIKQLREKQDHRSVKQQRRNEHCKHPKPGDEHGFCVLTGDKAAYHQEHAQARGKGKIALIYTARKGQHHKRRDKPAACPAAV